MKKILAISLFLFSTASFAVVNGTVQGATKTALGGVLGQLLWKSGGGTYLMRNVPVAASSMNAAMLRRMASPWGLALTAAAVAAGYLFQNGELKTPGEGTSGTALGSCRRPSGTFFSGNHTLQGCIDQWTTTYPNNTGKVATKVSDCVYRLNFVPNGVGTSTLENWWTNGSPCDDDTNPIGGDYAEPTTLTDTQKTAFRESQTAKSPREMMTDDAGNADRQIPEVSTALDDMADDYAKDNDKLPDGSPDTSTNPDTNPATGDDGTASESSQPPNPPTDGTSTTSENPDLCALHPDIIACQVMDDPVPEEPVTIQEQSVSLDTTPTMSAVGSCPAPLVAHTMTAGDITFSFDYLCDFASMIRNIVITLAYLVGAYIFVGGRSQTE